MNSPETPGATKPSLAQDWLNAVRYWLRGRSGVIALVVLAVVVGAALSWSWLVALGIAPLLLAFAPCAAMCALGLCASKMAGRPCSTESNPVPAPQPDARVAPSLEASEAGPVPLLADRSTLPDEPTASLAISVTEPQNPRKGADMSKHLRTLAAGGAIALGLAVAPALYAQDYLSTSHGSMMGEGMMGSMMSGMMSMMGMSGDMGGMMAHCGQMMQAMDGDHADRPNDQWRLPDSEEPAQPRE